MRVCVAQKNANNSKLQMPEYDEHDAAKKKSSLNKHKFLI